MNRNIPIDSNPNVTTYKFEVIVYNDLFYRACYILQILSYCIYGSRIILSLKYLLLFCEQVAHFLFASARTKKMKEIIALLNEHRTKLPQILQLEHTPSNITETEFGQIQVTVSKPEDYVVGKHSLLSFSNVPSLLNA